MADVFQDQTLTTAQTTGKAKPVAVEPTAQDEARKKQQSKYIMTNVIEGRVLDPQADRKYIKDLETIGKHAPFIKFMGSDYLFRSAIDDPNKAHTIAILVGSKSFQGFDKTVQEFVFHTALALGQNATAESVVKLKDLVTSGSFASSSSDRQLEMLNKFPDTLFKQPTKAK